MALGDFMRRIQVPSVPSSFILQRKFLAIFSYSSLRLVVLVSDRPGGVPVPI